jgi:AcrR family transcriptional regulator
MSEALKQTRECLLEAAVNLFSEKGYAAVGTREIAEAAGANLASIKYHFGSKRDLYLAAIGHVMLRNEGESAWQILASLQETPAQADGALEAAVALVRFMRRFLRHLIQPGNGSQSCSSLIIREALTPSEAMDTIVDEFLTPNNELIVGALGRLVPDAERSHLEHLAAAVLGQLLHVRIFRPFVERLQGVDLSDAAELDEIAMHIAEFSLRGLGLNDLFIIEALQAARDNDLVAARGRRS